MTPQSNKYLAFFSDSPCMCKLSKIRSAIFPYVFSVSWNEYLENEMRYQGNLNRAPYRFDSAVHLYITLFALIKISASGHPESQHCGKVHFRPSSIILSKGIYLDKPV